MWHPPGKGFCQGKKIPLINPSFSRILGILLKLTRPLNTKYLYNVDPTSLTLVRHCTNLIQMHCVYWPNRYNHFIYNLVIISILDMKGCICHLVKWQIHFFISKGTNWWSPPSCGEGAQIRRKNNGMIQHAVARSY